MQWQKEREELERMGTEMFSHSQTKYERTSIKTYFSNVDLSTGQFVGPQREGFPAAAPSERNYQNYVYRGEPGMAPRSMRSPSLPPIPREKFFNYPNSQTLIINPLPASDTGYHSETSPPNIEGPVEVWTNDDDGRGSNKTVTLRPRNVIQGHGGHPMNTPDLK